MEKKTSLGRPGVDAHVKHEECAAVLRLQFLINEGALVSATEDDTLHLWNFRQKIPQVVHSLKFQRDRLVISNGLTLLSLILSFELRLLTIYTDSCISCTVRLMATLLIIHCTSEM